MIENTNELALTGAGLVGAITLAYKFFRIIKSDNNKDQIDSEEKEFRSTLLAEVRELRVSNQTLLNERGELMAKISRLESELAWMKTHLQRLEKVTTEVTSRRNV